MTLAQRNDIPQLPDGRYEIQLMDVASQHDDIIFQIHTVQTGTLAGQRIVKMRQSNGGWKGFANLKIDNDGNFDGLYVWSRMRNQVDSDYITNVSTVITRFILRVRNGLNSDNVMMMVVDCPVVPSHIRRCNVSEASYPAPDNGMVNYDPVSRRFETIADRVASGHVNGMPEPPEPPETPRSRFGRARLATDAEVRANSQTVRRERRCAMSFFDSTVVR